MNLLNDNWISNYNGHILYLTNYCSSKQTSIMILAFQHRMVLPALLAASTVFSQTKADTLWSKGFPNEKMTMGMLTADGTPLIYSDMGGLYGMDPQSGKVSGGRMYM